MKFRKKIAVLIGDGMADYPIAQLGNKTPLEAANTPNMDYLAKNGLFGLTRTVPEGMLPGSDTANLSIFGYDPRKYYTGRAPLEAINMNIKLAEHDLAFRCNLVTVENNIMKDFSAGHIDNRFSGMIIDEIKKNIQIPEIEFYAGVSYRNIMVWRNYPWKDISVTIPPHDIQFKDINAYLPEGSGSELLRKLISESAEIINNSDNLKKAASEFKGKPTSIWLWGGGFNPLMDTLEMRFGLRGFTISAVDLIHGIGRAAGLMPIHVPGATGYIDTDYKGKAAALKQGMKNGDVVFLHVESPDESGHEGNLEHKIKSIEDFDKMIVGPVADYMQTYKNYSILVMPDHPTPISLRTHTAEPVPFVISGSAKLENVTYPSDIQGFNEKSASSGVMAEHADKLLGYIVSGRFGE